MKSPIDDVPPQQITGAFVISALRELAKAGIWKTTVANIKEFAANSRIVESGMRCEIEWIEPCLRDFIQRGYLTLLRSPHRKPIVGMTTTSLDEVNFAKANLRIEPSILHATVLPQPMQQQINVNHGEQYFGHASKLVEIQNNFSPSSADKPSEKQSASEKLSEKTPPKRKRGRIRGFRDSDPELDQRIAEAWDKGYGQYTSHQELAREFGVQAEDVRRALDRHRKR